ncbi:hypothetical protein [Portibacter lacus]|nr:hypothetical protein [Portibacter lacus]
MRLYHLILLFSFVNLLNGQSTVVIESSGIDSAHLIVHQGNLTVNGEVNAQRGVILGTLSSEKPGAIKFENGLFYGFDGATWIPLSLNREKYILGPSNLTTDGSFSYNSFTGLVAADAMCKATYPEEPSAHFYDVSEINDAMSHNNMGTLSLNTDYWVMSTSYRAGTVGSNLTSFSNYNNCFSYLSSSGALSERGTVFTYSISAPYAGQLTGINSNFKNNISCGTQLRLVCGR